MIHYSLEPTNTATSTFGFYGEDDTTATNYFFFDDSTCGCTSVYSEEPEEKIPVKRFPDDIEVQYTSPFNRKTPCLVSKSIQWIRGRSPKHFSHRTLRHLGVALRR